MTFLGRKYSKVPGDEAWRPL